MKMFWGVFKQLIHRLEKATLGLKMQKMFCHRETKKNPIRFGQKLGLPLPYLPEDVMYRM